MPVSYTKTGGQGHIYQVPDYPETADGPKAFKDFADFLDLILPPVGTIMPFVGNSAPTGWLLCQGQTVSSATYPKLSVECGTKFGTAPAGQFRLPDLKGRMVVGLDSSQTEFDAIGKTGGAKSVTLTVSNMPAHTHTTPDHTHTATTSGLSASNAGGHSHTVSGSTATDGQHQHQYYNSSFTSAAVASGTGANRLWQETVSEQNTFNTFPNTILHSHSINLTSSSQADHTHTITGNVTINSSGASNTGSSGSGTAVNTMNPYITMNHIIRAA
jgi:microcystin-dependent protein